MADFGTHRQTDPQRDDAVQKDIRALVVAWCQQTVQRNRDSGAIGSLTGGLLLVSNDVRVVIWSVAQASTSTIYEC